MNSKNKITAVVAVKGDSERVPKKNLRPFGDTSLLELKLNQLIELETIDKIIVSSESETALNIASNFKKVLTHKRDNYYSTSHVPMSEVYSYIASCIDAEHIMWTQVTSPLTTTKIYNEAIKTYNNLSDNFDCLLSCVNINEYLLKNDKPINFTRTPWQKSQDLKDIKALSFAINILKRSDLIEWGSLVGLKPFYLELPKDVSLDIDDIHDFNICESIYLSNIK